MQHFGFGSLEELPRTDELPIVLRDRVSLGVDGLTEETGAQEGQEVSELADGAEETVVDPESEPVSTEDLGLVRDRYLEG